MPKMTIRRACLGGAALLLAVCSLLSLCFPVVRLSLTNALNGVGGVNELLETYGLATASENGFALLGGNSRVLLFFREFCIGFVSSSGIDYRMTDFSGLEVFSQVFDIIILILSIFLVIVTVYWFFCIRKEGVVTTVALIAAWIGIVYLVQGLTFSLLLEAEWDKMLDMVGSGAVFFGDMFSTLSYVPFILIVLFEVAFWILYYRVETVKEPQGAESEEQEREAGQESKDMFTLLRECKKLLDEGILTEQEFAEQKAKILSKHE